MHDFSILVLGRFLLALGSGVGLKMTFTLINDFYPPVIASQKISYLMIAFAITPGLGVMLGGIMNTYFGWESTFYTGAFYGIILLASVAKLSETKTNLDLNALKLKYLLEGYGSQFKNLKLISGGLIMGGATCFVYVFAALAPFIAMNILHMSSSFYGIANLLPAIGLVGGSLLSAQLTKRYPLSIILALGIFISLGGSVMMLIFVLLKMPPLIMLFIPMMFCYFGLAFVFANASSIAMDQVTDKAHASAVMNFINMGFATVVVLLLGLLPNTAGLLPWAFICICGVMFALYNVAISK